MSGWYALLLVFAATGFLATVVAHRSTLLRGWNTTSTAVFGAAWLLNVEHLVAALSGAFTVSHDPVQWDWNVTYGALPHFAHQLGQWIIVGAGAVLAVRVVRRRPRVNLFAVLWLLLLILSLASALANGLSPRWSSIVGVVFIAGLGVVLPAGHGARLGAAMFAASLIPVAAFMLVATPRAAMRHCTLKCTPLGRVYTGPFVNENAFGLTLALALPFVLLALHGVVRLAAVSNLIVMVLATGSRTAWLSIVATLAVYLSVIVGGRLRVGTERRVMATAAAAISAAALALPLWRAALDSSEFTGRASYWAVALRHLRSHWLLGRGMGAWDQLRSIKVLTHGATYSPHNQWLEVLVAGGVLAGLVFAAALVVLYRSAEDRLATGLVIVAVMSAGSLEAPWSTAHPDWLYWSVLAAAVAGTGRKMRTERGQDQPLAPPRPAPPVKRSAPARATSRTSTP